MTKYNIDFREWSEESIIDLNILLNDLMTRVSNTYANSEEEASWLRRFESDMDKLINKEESNHN